ncbi:hypothetical protein BH23ACT11_BH23ACT11_04790 [soil metagenome]
MVFTTLVVSPAFKGMKWSEAERVGARSAVGRQYAKVGTTNLVLLLVFAVLDGLVRDFGAVFYVEYGLILVLFVLVGMHGAYFGRRLATLAEDERRAESAEEARKLAGQRHELQRLSFGVSMFDLTVSVMVVILAVNV